MVDSSEQKFIDQFLTVELYRKEEEDEDIVYWYEGVIPDNELDEIAIKVDLYDETIHLSCTETTYISVSSYTIGLMNKIMEFIKIINTKLEKDPTYEPPHIQRINMNKKLK